MRQPLRDQRKGYRLFGGDAARQRAVAYARERRWEVLRLDYVDPRKFGLNLWGYDDDGTRYEYVAVRRAGPHWFRTPSYLELDE